MSEEWKSTIGANTSVSWPVGVGGKGNEGVTATVKQVPNSIGYVEYAYAKQNKLSYALIQNKDGKYPVPEIETFAGRRGQRGLEITPASASSCNNQPGEKAWPITSATFILMHKKSDKPEGSAAALKFFDWAYTNGDKLAIDLEYVPLPANVKDQVRAVWKAEIKDTNGKPLF